MGHAELLEDRLPADASVAGILDGARRLSEHLDKILSYTALLSESLPFHPSEVAAEEVVAQVREAMASACDAAGLLLHTAIAPALPFVSADAYRLGTALIELLRNALRFTPAGGAIGLEARAAGHAVAFEVWDTGPGIAEAERARIWEPFGQVAGGDTTRTGGLGLGLPIAKMLVEQQGGAIAYAPREGGGSRFTVTLPASGPSP